MPLGGALWYIFRVFSPQGACLTLSDSEFSLLVLFGAALPAPGEAPLGLCAEGHTGSEDREPTEALFL